MRKFLLAGAATVAMTGAAGAAGLEPSQPSNTHNIMLRAEPGKAIVRLDGYVFGAIGVGSSTNDKATVAVGGVVGHCVGESTVGDGDAGQLTNVPGLVG